MSTAPTRFTAPLLADEQGLPVHSDGYRLIELVEKYWTIGGQPLHLDQWQADLLVRILERFPPGHSKAGELRYRQLVVSIPRQAGKSLLAGILSLYGLLQHCHAPKVLGLARGREQAEIVYGYTKDAITASPALRQVLRETSTRGISKANGVGSYKVLPAKPEAVQGYLSTLALCDELHVMAPEIWDAVVQSQRAQTDPLLIGITTAGDIKSTLLKRLYVQGQAAINGEHERFGFFCFEAPKGSELTLEAITAANPAVACGRIDAQTIYDDEIASPAVNWKRYTLNLFVDGLAEPWVPVEAWSKCGGTGITAFTDVVYSVDVTNGWTYGSITAARREGELIETEYLIQLERPDLEKLVAECVRLRKLGRCSFVVSNDSLFKRLKEKGYDVRKVYGSTKDEASSLVYGLIMRGLVRHENNEEVNTQMATAKTKNNGDSFRMVPGSGYADAAYATVYGIYAAATNKKKGLSLF